jgi:putative transcriptional regulator
MDAVTMHGIDALCLPPVKTSMFTQIKRLRTRYKASQAVFAAYLEYRPLDCAEVGAGPEEAKWAFP